MYYTYTDSPLGEILLVGDASGLAYLYRQDTPRPGEIDPAWERDDTAFPDVKRQLAEYFDGDRREFDVTLNPRGSAFQLQVWSALTEIPYGETASYGQIAAKVGLTTYRGPRAVGRANGQNPLPIIVPCHRVIGADGSLVGYGGGLPAKRFLLALEATHSGLFAVPSPE
ncbi:MAG TPA: methylated-DNA--[protein]-cysteine S-methyltransferase [Pseudonocardiaceae bacterium]|jgi:methylated-DNA-[protein]-cysteine S-methyltransferase|nr:methylated-DNA--[protein]-cysteine S-methyltransferase [Pseudonocardiaceae bacterium]